MFTVLITLFGTCAVVCYWAILDQAARERRARFLERHAREWAARERLQ